MDDIGHGVRFPAGLNQNRTKQRGPSQGSIQSIGTISQGSGAQLGPAPTTKPPTPPQAMRTSGTLSKSSREYRTPPAVAPPQVNFFSTCLLNSTTNLILVFESNNYINTIGTKSLCPKLSSWASKKGTGAWLFNSTHGYQRVSHIASCSSPTTSSHGLSNESFYW